MNSNTNDAAARIARIAARYANNPAALAAWIRQERETLCEMNGWAFFNGGRSAELQSANEAFAAFMATR